MQPNPHQFVPQPQYANQYANNPNPNTHMQNQHPNNHLNPSYNQESPDKASN